jgi:hypothetical protein
MDSSDSLRLDVHQAYLAFTITDKHFKVSENNLRRIVKALNLEHND